MIVKNKKLRFLGFLLSLTVLLGFMSSNSFVLAETQTEAALSTAPSEEETETTADESIVTEEIVVENTLGAASDQTRAAPAETYSFGEFPEGIYALQSYTAENRWMDIQQNLTTPGAHVQQYSYNNRSPAISYQSSGVFRLSRVGTTSRYIIRLMLDNSLTFTFDEDGYVVTKRISLNDNEVSIDDTFYITFNASDAVAIRKHGTNSYICSNSTTASGMSGAPDSFLVADSVNPATDNRTLWKLEGAETSLPEGVYCFKNMGNSSMWMDTQQDLAEPGVHIQQYAYSTLPITSFSRGALFKISYEGTTFPRTCTIRSMLDNSLSFEISGNEVLTKTIPDDDRSVEYEDRFYIRFYHSGFIIHPGNSSYVIAPRDTDASGYYGAPESYLTTNANNNMSEQAFWKPYRYTGVERSSFLLYYPVSWRSTGIATTESYTASLSSWSTKINANTPHITIGDEHEALAELTWNASNHRFTLNVRNPGLLRLNVYRTVGGTSTIDGSGMYEFYIVPQEGTYYIQNAATERYIEIEGPSSSAGAAIQQWEFHDGNNMKWMVEHVEDSGGYVRLKSVHSNLYIGVDSTNTDLIKQYGTQNDYTLWKIDRTLTGNLMFKCKATETTGSVMSLPNSSQINGVNIAQATYTDDISYKDEWYLLAKVISYVNYYDSTFDGNNPLIYNVILSNSFSNLVYARYFNVGLFMDYVANTYINIVDICPTGAGSPCNSQLCGENCSELHHKNTLNISDYFFNAPREDNHIYTFWTDRNSNFYCKEIDNIHSFHNACACVWNRRPVIHVMDIFPSTENAKLAYMSVVVVHETAHAFNMDEKYDDYGHDKDGQTICAMEKIEMSSIQQYYTAVKSGAINPFCASCMIAMQTHVSQLTISGNQAGG